ncbi:MAG: sulfur carrier protein ThiS [Rhizomicrobium sp.]
MPIAVIINGEEKQLDGPMSVADLLQSLNLPAAKVAIECNLEIVPRTAYGQTLLSAGDRIEIVHFIGGG